MRKTILLVATVAAMLVAVGGVALAASMACDGGLCKGTNSYDTIKGSNKHDKIYGRGGNDQMRGECRGDLMYGQNGADTIRGGYGRDTIYGQAHNDAIYGQADNDKLYGGAGLDTVKGGPGHDYINVAGDGRADSVDCGTGSDTVVVDDADLGEATTIDFFRITSCEEVIVR